MSVNREVGMTENGHKGCFGDNTNVVSLDCGNGTELCKFTEEHWLAENFITG